MVIFRGILGIIFGVGLAYLAGILLDYFNIYKGADYTRVYPFLTALGGAIGSFIAVLIRGSVGSSRVVVERASKVKAKDDAMSRLAQSMSSPQSSRTPASGSAGSSASASPAAPGSRPGAGEGRVSIGESRDVPGMPSFEVQKNQPIDGSGSRPKAKD